MPHSSASTSPGKARGKPCLLVFCTILAHLVRVSRNETRKGKAHLELNLDKDVKNNKKNVFKYINNKRKTKKTQRR